MRLRTTRKTTALLAAGLIAMLMTIGLTAQADSNARPSGKGIVHRNGKAVGSKARPVAETYSVGGHALEPTLGVDPGGDIFYAAAGFDSIGGQAGTQILQSTDGGKTWENKSPRVLDRNAMPLTLDPYVWVDDRVDGDNARIFTIDLTLACSYMSFSDDGGETWITNPLSCGRPVNDHQTLFSGPPVQSPTVGYPNIVYYCWNDVASSACSKSLDGGITFHPTGSPAFAGAEPGNSDSGFGVEGVCGGLHGHGAVSNDGVVYLPREYCGSPRLAISKDEGRTWTEAIISKKIRSTSQPTGGAGHPSVSTDEKGNVYYLWHSAKTRQMYLSVSRDEGETWSKPVIASPPGLNETNLPQIDARGKGKIAFVYYGSSNSPFPKCKRECENEEYEKTTWNAYVTVSDSALSKNPTFYTGTINDPKDPLVTQRCGPGRCKEVYDFIDVEIGPDGIAYGAFVDGCMMGCVKDAPEGTDYEGLISKLVGAPRLN
ncbi:MAG: sialidase family protein [Actinomycetota bacterium]